jgi:uncharacterized protein (TIGR02145 family)
MKKIIFVLLMGIAMLYSCSSDNSPDSIPESIPISVKLPNAPSELIRVPSNNNPKIIRFIWTDNSNDETGFKIERKTNSGPYELFQNLTVNLVDFTFSDLAANTTYSYRICSYNNKGNSTSYSNEYTVSTDIDRNAYTNIKIGNQIWMKENYFVTKYKNGDIIPKMQQGQAVLTPTGYVLWSSLRGFGAYMNPYYGTSSVNYDNFYNWYAVNDSRGLAPEGWHIPTKEDWIILQEYLGGNLVAGGKMKMESISWRNPNTGATNSSDFSGLPSGYFKLNGTAYASSREENGASSYFWSSTEFDSQQAYNYRLRYDSTSLIESYVSDSKVQGMTIRCIKN